MSPFGIALIEKPGEEGLTRTECMDLFDMLGGLESYPVEFEAKEHESAAMGFISFKAADEF